MTNTTPNKATKLAKKLLDEVAKHTKNGLPKCYKKPEDFASEMYTSYLPWDDTILESLDYIISNPSAIDIVEEFTKKFNYDLMAEFKRGKKSLQNMYSTRRKPRELFGVFKGSQYNIGTKYDYTFDTEKEAKEAVDLLNQKHGVKDWTYQKVKIRVLSIDTLKKELDR